MQFSVHCDISFLSGADRSIDFKEPSTNHFLRSFAPSGARQTGQPNMKIESGRSIEGEGKHAAAAKSVSY